MTNDNDMGGQGLPGLVIRLHHDLMVIALYQDHPYQDRAAHAAAILRGLLTDSGFKTDDPEDDGMFDSAAEAVRPAMELSHDFDRLFRLAIRSGVLEWAHAVNRAWVEFTVEDPDHVGLPCRDPEPIVHAGGETR